MLQTCCSLLASVGWFFWDTKEVPCDKTCTDLLQKWQIPWENLNKETLLFKGLVFEKAAAEKDENNSKKRPVVTGRRDFLRHNTFCQKWSC